MSDSLRPHELQHARPPRPSPTHRVHPNPCSLNRWRHPIISFSVVPFSSCPQFFPGSGSFQMSQLHASGGQSIGVSASTSVLPVNTQDWSPLGWTDWIFLQSKGLSRVFSNTTVQKHQFFSAQLSSQPNSHIHTSIQFSSVAQSCLTLAPWTAAQQASLSITNSWSLLKPMSIESVVPSNHLILCRSLLLLLPICRSIRVTQPLAWQQPWLEGPLLIK